MTELHSGSPSLKPARYESRKLIYTRLSLGSSIDRRLNGSEFQILCLKEKVTVLIGPELGHWKIVRLIIILPTCSTFHGPQ